MTGTDRHNDYYEPDPVLMPTRRGRTYSAEDSNTYAESEDRTGIDEREPVERVSSVSISQESKHEGENGSGDTGRIPVAWADLAKQPIPGLPSEPMMFDYQNVAGKTIHTADGGWRFEWPDGAKQPTWTTGNLQKTAPIEAHRLIQGLMANGPAMWRRLKCKELANGEALHVPHWVQRLAEDIAPLSRLQYDESQFPQLAAFVKEKQLLVADFMYAFSLAEGGHDGDPLVFMQDFGMERPYYILRTPYDERKVLSAFEYNIVTARFEAAMERTYSKMELQQSTRNSVIDEKCAKSASGFTKLHWAYEAGLNDGAKLHYWYAGLANGFPEPVSFVRIQPRLPFSASTSAIDDLDMLAQIAAKIHDHYSVLCNLLDSYIRNNIEGPSSEYPNVAPRKRSGHNESDDRPCLFARATENVDLSDRRCQGIQKAAWHVLMGINRLATDARWESVWSSLQPANERSAKEAVNNWLFEMLPVALRTHFEGWLIWLQSHGGVLTHRQAMLKGADGSLVSGVDDVD